MTSFLKICLRFSFLLPRFRKCKHLSSAVWWSSWFCTCWSNILKLCETTLDKWCSVFSYTSSTHILKLRHLIWMCQSGKIYISQHCILFIYARCIRNVPATYREVNRYISRIASMYQLELVSDVLSFFIHRRHRRGGMFAFAPGLACHRMKRIKY